MFDVFFISYDEPVANQNFLRVLTKVPRAIHLQGIRGTKNAYFEAASQSKTEFLYIVEADNKVFDWFKFPEVSLDYDFVIWQSFNSLTKVSSHSGGIKLMKKRSMLKQPPSGCYSDLTISLIGSKLYSHLIASELVIDSTPLIAFRSAFRECARLAEKQVSYEVHLKILDNWLNVNKEIENAKYVIEGAKCGYIYGLSSRKNIQAMHLINDYEFLQEQFEAVEI